MIIDLKETEENILSKLTELCDQYNFQRYAHPGSLATLNRPVNTVTALLRFIGIDNPRPDNLNAPCINLIPEVRFEVHTINLDYRTHFKIYDLAKAISNKLRGRKDLLVFCEGSNNTQLSSFISDFRFLEIGDDGKDRGMYSYSFDLIVPFGESYRTQRV